MMAFKSYRQKAEREIDKALRRKNEAAAIAVENEAKKLSPVDTGRLRSSLSHDSDESGCVVGTNVEYGAYQEFGTRYQSGTSYLRPGLLKAIPTLRRIYGG